MDDRSSAEAAEPGAYSDISPFVRLFSHPVAAETARVLLVDGPSSPDEIADRTSEPEQGVHEVLAALDEADIARNEQGRYAFDGAEDVETELTTVIDSLPRNDIKYTDVLGDETAVRVIDALLRKHYVGCTVEMIAKMTDEHPAEIDEVVTAFADAGLLTTPDEHPAEVDIIKDGAADADNCAYVVDVDDETVCALGRLQTELLGRGHKLPSPF